MKGAIPLIIASVIVLAILLSSLYFITTVNIRSSIAKTPYSVIEWMRIEEELDTLAQICLRESSRYADQVFVSTYNELTQDIDYTNIQEALYELEQAVITASQLADQAMDRKFNEILGNWSLLKEREGYIVSFEEKNSTYYVGFGEGYSNIYFRVKIINLNGEYRVFTRNYTVYFGLELERTNIDLLSIMLDLLRLLGLDFIPGVNLTVTFRATAYVDFNGVKQYYIISRESGEIIANDILRGFLSRLLGGGGTATVTYTPAGMFYYGEGKTEIVYYLDVSAALASILMIIFEGDVVGATSYIDVDGFIARSAISIV